MFGWFSSDKKASLKNPIYLEQFINNAYVTLSNSIKTPDELYQFLIEDLCGAAQGNNDAKQLLEYSGFHEIEYRDALNQDSIMDLPNSALSILNNSISPQLVKELGLNEAIKIRCNLVKKLIDANHKTLTNSRVTFARNILQTGSFYLSEYEIQEWTNVINSLLQGDIKSSMLKPYNLTKVINTSNRTEKGSYFNIFKDIEDYLSSPHEDSHSIFMPLLYALRIAYAGMYTQGLCSKVDFDAIDQGFFNRVVLIGASISREEQISFQEQSLDCALEWLNEHYLEIDREISAHLINAAKLGFSLFECINEMNNNIEIPQIKDFTSQLKLEYLEYFDYRFCTLFFKNESCLPDTSKKIFSLNAFRFLLNPEIEAYRYL